jgi:hypothetical protein
MGINLEYITLLSLLKQKKQLPSAGSVLELGKQDISGEPAMMAEHFSHCFNDKFLSSLDTARQLYMQMGFDDYRSIDAIEGSDTYTYDLNINIRSVYQFEKQFALVTNLGTVEHVFNIAMAFQNMHNLCAENGLMIHALPSCGNVNHGYYNLHPRLLAELAFVNQYEILSIYFTVDYKPVLYEYSADLLRLYDDRDILLYVVYKKINNAEFKTPFDSVFSQCNSLAGYNQMEIAENFSPYIKATWENVKPKNINNRLSVPVVAGGLLRKLKKRLITYIGLSITKL